MARRSALLFIMLAAMCLVTVACAMVRKPASRGPKQFTLIATNGTAGALEPRGCACRRMGGMTRRAGFITGMSAGDAPVLVLDSGNLLFKSATAPDLQTAKAMLDSISRMQTAALNISVRDCAAGADFLKKNAAPTTLISSNLKDRATGELLFNPYLITTINRVRIGVFGLSGPAASGPRSVHADDPVACAVPVVQALQRARCDVIVVLSQLTEARNQRVLARVPGIHFVVGSSDGAPNDTVLRSANAHIVSPGQHGTHAAVIEVTLNGQGPAFIPAAETPGSDPQHAGQELSRGCFAYRLAALDSTVPGDPVIELLIESFRQARLRRTLQSQGLRYLDTVPAVNIQALDEAAKNRAVRLMNEMFCEGTRIAQCAAGTQLCRDMGRIVAEGVRTGMGDGEIQFKVLREMQALRNRPDIPLDKPALR